MFIKDDNMKRICIVTGIHGDELEGQYVCYELMRKINEKIENLHGIVDIYPTLNPLGIDSVHRGMPTFDLDMNRIFPGSENGAMAEYMAAKVIDDIKGADMCIDLHASNIFLKEAPQVRISEETKEKLLPFKYGIGAMREAVAGILPELLYKDIILLLVYFVIFMGMGIILKAFVNKHAKKFTEKLNESGILGH